MEEKGLETQDTAQQAFSGQASQEVRQQAQYAQPAQRKFGIMKAEQICGEVAKAISGKKPVLSPALVTAQISALMIPL